MASRLPTSTAEDKTLCRKTQAQVDFVSYEKMSEDTNPWPSRKLNSIKQWVATEKVHGANFSFTAQYLDTEKSRLVVKVAKRGEYLKDSEYFFGVHRQEGFLGREKERVVKLFSAVSEMFGSHSMSVLAVTVYGELFGGFYPHTSIPPCPGVIPVQTEVVYCPDLRFMAYDIALFSKPTTAEECLRSYLDYDVCIKLFKSCGFLYAEPVATGSLQAMLNYPLGFNTKLPSKLGMPQLPADTKPNRAEGIVIKPVKTLVLDTAKGERRVIFKRKIEGFMEKKQRNWQDGKKGASVGYNQEYELLRYEMLAMVTEQRLVNVISKFGVPVATMVHPFTTEPKTETKVTSEGMSEEWSEIEGELVGDVLEELTLEQEELWTSFQQQWPMLVGQLMEELKQECTCTVQQYREQHQ